MSFKEKLAKGTRLNASILPSGYQIIGDVLLFKLPKIKDEKLKQKIAEATLKILPYAKTVCETKGISGEFREPQLKILSGKGTETVHKENNCIFKLDVSKIMFSKGNLQERKRIIPLIKKGEIVVDGFAGIGYFSIGISKFSKAEKIYSIEKNKISFGYLNQNVQLNRLENIQPIYSDFRKVRVDEKADRILMGYLPKTYRFLPAAFRMLKNKGTIHYHDIFSKKELWEKPINLLEKYSKQNGFRLEKIKNKKIVKSYAPNVYHVVLDAVFSKTNK